MSPAEIVSAAIPGATDEYADMVLWGRTCYPFGRVTPRDLYRAAHRLQRAHDGGKMLCEMCDRLATNAELCERCTVALRPSGIEGE